VDTSLVSLGFGPGFRFLKTRPVMRSATSTGHAVKILYPPKR